MGWKRTLPRGQVCRSFKQRCHVFWSPKSPSSLSETFSQPSESLLPTVSPSSPFRLTSNTGPRATSWYAAPIHLQRSTLITTAKQDEFHIENGGLPTTSSVGSEIMDIVGVALGFTQWAEPFMGPAKAVLALGQSIHTTIEVNLYYAAA